MKKYQYQLLRYVHDQFTGEFVNVGIILYSPDSYFIKSKIISRLNRISALFPNAKIKFLKKLIYQFDNEISNISKDLSGLFKPSIELNMITNKILPDDDSSLQLSKVFYGIDVDLEISLNDLYISLIEKYVVASKKSDSLSDEDVWRLKYKEYFDKYKISRRLKKHNIITTNDVFTFEKTWKNEIWHCYEPISFAMHNKDDIKDKVYKWVGRIQEIKNSEERINLTFLSSISEEHYLLKDFIIKNLKNKSEYVNIEVVLDSEAEIIAKKIQEQMLAHDNLLN